MKLLITLLLLSASTAFAVPNVNMSWEELRRDTAVTVNSPQIPGVQDIFNVCATESSLVTMTRVSQCAKWEKVPTYDTPGFSEPYTYVCKETKAGYLSIPRYRNAQMCDRQDDGKHQDEKYQDEESKGSHLHCSDYQYEVYPKTVMLDVWWRNNDIGHQYMFSKPYTIPDCKTDSKEQYPDEEVDKGKEHDQDQVEPVPDQNQDQDQDQVEPVPDQDQDQDQSQEQPDQDADQDQSDSHQQDPTRP